MLSILRPDYVTGVQRRYAQPAPNSSAAFYNRVFGDHADVLGKPWSLSALSRLIIG
eukprot:SAG11_NODE_12659_length_692_cov_0.664418_1_plen_55_part_10